MDTFFEVLVSFITNGSNQPLKGDYKVRMYNTDFFGDDYVGETTLDDKGVACFRFAHDAFVEWDLERHTENYFVLYKAGQKVFHTKLEEKDIANLTKLKAGDKEMVEMGVFEVEEE